jgi:UDP-N-acetylglucosamine transferase subunit ALG13
MRGSGTRVLFAVGHWGLGHATRDLPLIRGLLSAGCHVTVVCDGPPLEVLKRELGDACDYVEDIPGSPIPMASTPFRFYCRYTFLLPAMALSTSSQYIAMEWLIKKRRIHIVISDNRYAFGSRQVESYLIAHGLRFILPWNNPPLDYALECFNAWSFRYYTKILVPDFAGPSLSGRLSHDLRVYDPRQIAYIGPISSLRRRDIAQDLDYFITLSGPEPQRTLFEERVLAQIGNLPGKGVVTLGKPGRGYLGRQSNFEIFGYLGRDMQEIMMNRARLVISRSGYTTLMELAELGKKALLVPTPGQTEQEYLAKLHKEQGNWYSVTQDELDLQRDIPLAETYPGYQTSHRTEDTVQNFLNIVLGNGTDTHDHIETETLETQGTETREASE